MPFAAWGEICASGAPNDFSRSSETPNAPTHFPDEPKITALQLNICLDFVDRTFGDNKKRF